MSGQLVDLDDHRPVWRVVKAKCRVCGHEVVSVQHMNCSLDAAECSRCGQMKCAVTHYLRPVRDSLGPEDALLVASVDHAGVWEPRLEVVS